MHLRLLAAAFSFLGLVACGGFATRLADNLTVAVENQNDPATVRDGAPAYLLMIDALIAEEPENSRLLLTGAKLYGAYAAAFVREPARRRTLADKALHYAYRALCGEAPSLCRAIDQPYADFVLALHALDQDRLAVLYGYAAAWATWLQTYQDDWQAVAELPKIRAAMQRVLALQPAYAQGDPHLYLGIIETLLPPGMGGKPELGRDHFEYAIQLSEGKNLMARVLFARHYARLMFDRELHDAQLRLVLASDPNVPGLTLSNVLAQAEARELLAGGDDYF